MIYNEPKMKTKRELYKFFQRIFCQGQVTVWHSTILWISLRYIAQAQLTKNIAIDLAITLQYQGQGDVDLQ